MESSALGENIPTWMRFTWPSRPRTIEVGKLWIPMRSSRRRSVSSKTGKARW